MELGRNSMQFKKMNGVRKNLLASRLYTAKQSLLLRKSAKNSWCGGNKLEAGMAPGTSRRGVVAQDDDDDELYSSV